MPTTPLDPRRLTLDDLEAVCDLLRASDLAVLGHLDFTDDEIAADLKRPEVEAYGVDHDGQLVAYGWTARTENSERADVDLCVHPDHPGAPTLGPAMTAFLEQRAAALVADAGHDVAVLDIGVYRQDTRTRSWLEARGFSMPTSFVRMRIDLDRPVPEPVLPSGVGVRRVEEEADLQAAHAVYERGFVEHYSHTRTSFAHFRSRLAERGPGFTQVWLAEVDRAAAAVLVGTRQFEQDQDAGYVRTLATAPEARGRGLGKALLRTYFRAAQQEGRTAALLHVDVANVTDALRLYESVGMRPVLTIDAWTKRVPAGS